MLYIVASFMGTTFFLSMCDEALQGQVRAQKLLAERLHQSGNLAEAQKWLRRAAEEVGTRGKGEMQLWKDMIWPTSVGVSPEMWSNSW